MACPASLALLSMSAISFLVLVVVRCSPWIRPTVDTQAPWPQAPTSHPMRSMPAGCAAARAHACSWDAPTWPAPSGQLPHLAQSLPCLLLAVLGQLLRLSTLGLATVPVGVGVLLPGPPVTAPALPGVRRLCQRHRPPPWWSAGSAARSSWPPALV